MNSIGIDGLHHASIKKGLMLCAQVLKALQACFQSDNGAFVTPELFKRLLPPLVSQLKGGPPAEAQSYLAADMAPGEPAAAETDVYGETAVTTLIELAASTGNDELWKPFNHQVLLCVPTLTAFRRRQASSLQGLLHSIALHHLMVQCSQITP